MPFPIVTVTGQTGTGDTVVGPGAPTVLVGGKPVALVGDQVVGAALTGAITQPGNPKIIIGGKPPAALTGIVSGTNPVTGVPVASPLAVTSAMTVII